MGNRQAIVSFDPPLDTGGSPITDYVVTSTPDNIMFPGNANADPVTVSGLAGGVSYTFTVKARNEAGFGPNSLPSNAVVPTDYYFYDTFQGTGTLDIHVPEVGTWRTDTDPFNSIPMASLNVNNGIEVTSNDYLYLCPDITLAGDYTAQVSITVGNDLSGGVEVDFFVNRFVDGSAGQGLTNTYDCYIWAGSNTIESGNGLIVECPSDTNLCQTVSSNFQPIAFSAGQHTIRLDQNNGIKVLSIDGTVVAVTDSENVALNGTLGIQVIGATVNSVLITPLHQQVAYTLPPLQEPPLAPTMISSVASAAPNGYIKSDIAFSPALTGAVAEGFYAYVIDTSDPSAFASVDLGLNSAGYDSLTNTNTATIGEMFGIFDYAVEAYIISDRVYDSYVFSPRSNVVTGMDTNILPNINAPTVNSVTELSSTQLSINITPDLTGIPTEFNLYYHLNLITDIGGVPTNKLVDRIPDQSGNIVIDVLPAHQYSIAISTAVRDTDLAFDPSDPDTIIGTPGIYDGAYIYGDEIFMSAGVQVDYPPL